MARKQFQMWQLPILDDLFSVVCHNFPISIKELIYV